jgi:hypothetical protein
MDSSYMRMLIDEGNDLRQKAESNLDFDGRREWLHAQPRLPAPVARLIPHLLETADAPPETITGALQILVFFAQGCRSKDNWRALSTGRYGEELVRQAWLLYQSMQWPDETWLRNTCAVLAALRHASMYHAGETGVEHLKRLVKSESREEIGLGLLTYAGLLWISGPTAAEIASTLPVDDIESRIFGDDAALCEAAIWAWASAHREQRARIGPTPQILSRLLSLWLGDTAAGRSFPVAAYALCQHMGLPRDVWQPALSRSQVGEVRIAAYVSTSDPEVRSNSVGAGLIAGFHAKNIWSDEELRVLLVNARNDHRFHIRTPAEDRHRITSMLEQMSESRDETAFKYFEKA